ncbi:virulence-associated protein e, putative [Heliomicrobium modesticaldum Ice1]|uniref:Virulence-associated protein e, putative n=1 Tax=Heliobacterium modesticaldum (strain ATCC 51547 / Ice1) TaxID=498761 RepID=B0TCZ9_HELMI|nr:virulence-associated E family protein [Heliomicrobium modesticaldum]ABZ85450.1 virulence-associated protein e, putative [Heliomicrobium modesticaldum Ice1]
MKISYGNSRMDKKWKNSDISWDDFCTRVNTTVRTTETVEEYRKLKKGQQDAIKDVGGYVAGHLKSGRRKKGFVLCRSMILLDMDYGTPGVWDEVIMKCDFRCCAYSTHKHTPEKPRIRLAIPLSRDVSEAEYPAVARMVAKDIGIDLFDDTTYEAHRLMYWPSTSMNGEFWFRKKDGIDINPDEYLTRYDDWQDESTWPRSSRQSEVVRSGVAEAGNPLTKPGIIGAFNRTYTVEEAIEAFLSDVYEPSAMNGRYDYIPADSSAGVVIYDSVYVYSHHATDPACGKLLNAFDLVRLHKFRALDDKSAEDTPVSKLPSYKAMTELAVNDERVKLLLAEERRAQASAEFAEEDTDWEKNLEYEPRSTVLKNSLGNLLLILKNDPKLQGIRYNRLANQIYGDDALPWERPYQAWRDADMAQLVAYVDKTYGTFSSRNYELALTKAADDRAYHPIRDYLDNLPEWDGTKRVETLLVRYFGAEDTEYTRMVTRKTLAAAVARIYQPGIKFDSMLVLNGRTDLGKSTFFARLAGEWFSDSLNFTDMGKGKDAAEKIQGVWIVEIPELAGLSKMDVNNIKGFLSRQDDQYRPSYGRTVESHPRQCIIVGSTNAENAGFLRDTTGNRRFWVVRVWGGSKKGWDLPETDVPQIWAEAKHYWKQGEKLYLEGSAAEQAKAEQTTALEADEREGVVREYLDMLLPDNWYDMDLYNRKHYFSSDDPLHPEGKNQREFVSNMEIWCECFGNDRGKFERQADSYKIKLIMQKIGGWVYSGQKKKIKGYGAQYVWVRTIDGTGNSNLGIS